MKLVGLAAPLALLAGAGCATQHAPSPEENAPLKVVRENATMPFANIHRQIDDWVVRKDGSLLIKSAGGKYYHATFFGPCPEIGFENRIGFKSDATGGLDRYSKIIVDGQICTFETFDEVANPRAPLAPKT